ncbi:hypothetical protein EKO27_g8154 [Xylaria grammica]|uniref:Uncharacterized protein n=1 Tax=Xylaria grammica TaxID=363999 RepID=A0A439CXL1_9PEZI|nr:hypothetical protein EKO27_g8154 [Xylaria grammica]
MTSQTELILLIIRDFEEKRRQFHTIIGHSWRRRPSTEIAAIADGLDECLTFTRSGMENSTSAEEYEMVEGMIDELEHMYYQTKNAWVRKTRIEYQLMLRIREIQHV